MAIVYFDASAFVKLLVAEPGTELAAELWDHCDAAVSSRLADPEVVAALAAARRNRDLSAAGLERAMSTWTEFWRSVWPIELTALVADHAGVLARAHSLGGADAVHLASALALEDPDLVVAAWDQRLSHAARGAGLAVAPAP